MVSKIITFFLPEAYRDVEHSDLKSAEAARRYKLNIIFSFTIGIFSAVNFMVRIILEPNSARSVYLGIPAIIIVLLMPFAIKFFSLRRSVFYICFFLCTTIIFIRSLDYGGINSPIVNWLTMIPLIALLLVGRKTAIATLLGVCALFFVLALPEFFNLNVRGFEASPYIKPIVLSFVTLVVSLLAYFFEAQRKSNEKLILNIEQELSSSKKLASLGGLSGGLAHEINNPLTILSGRISSLNKMLLNDEVDRDKMLHACSRAKSSVKRIDSIVNALRTFSREEYVEDFKELELLGLLNETLDGFSESDRLKITLNFPDSSQMIKGNAVLLQRVFTNLLRNSLDAVKEVEGAWVKIGLKQNGPIVLSFKDNGAGIKSDVAEYIMEPFFTTKAVGKGSGLGLSLSQNIMNLHGGSLKLNQESGDTEFLVTFSC